MFDNILFTLEDVRLVRKVSVNVDDFELYAKEVQINYLTKVLGDSLYNSLMNSPGEARMINLLDGVIYQYGGRDVIFRGIKRYLSYLWLYVYAIDSDIQHTKIGTMIFKDEFAERANKMKSYTDSRAHYIASAEGEEINILLYLNRNINIFPEFHDSFQQRPSENSNITFKAFGKSYKGPKQQL